MWSLSKNNKYCILRNKLTKKYADRSTFCVDDAHIYIYNINVRLNYWGGT